MKLSSLHDVLLHEIDDLYSAENQLLEVLPKMAKHATSTKLRKGFEHHLEETKEHVERLKEAAKELDHDIRGITCKGMEGLLKEGAEVLKQDPSEVIDVALISAAQRVEHYEIAAYGCVISYAEVMDHKKVVKLFKSTLDEEEKTDEKLSKVAESEVNEKANSMMS